MHLYWRPRSLPELHGLPRSVRQRLVTAAMGKADRDHQLAFPAFVLFACVLAPTLIVSRYDWAGGNEPGLDGMVSWVTAVLGGVCFGWLITGPIFLTRLRPYIREYLTAGA